MGATPEVRRFLGACAFYHIWIPHYAHIVDPLYHLLRKGKKFKWKPEHTKAMKKLQKCKDCRAEANVKTESREKDSRTVRGRERERERERKTQKNYIQKL